MFFINIRKRQGRNEIRTTSSLAYDLVKLYGIDGFMRVEMNHILKVRFKIIKKK